MTFAECLSLIKNDLNMFPNVKWGGVKYFLFNASFKFTVWLRLGAYLRGKKGLFKILYGIVFLIHKHNQYLTGIQVRIETKIEGGLRFQHFSGIVVNEGCKIGRNCLIFQNVTIGASSSGIPRIGNNVIICAGAVIIGNVYIGDNVIVGANSVVTHNIPPNTIVAGVPARVISENPQSKMNDYMYH